MYRRPKFLEKLHDIRCEMAAEADYDVELFVEMLRHDAPSADAPAEGPDNAADARPMSEKLVSSRDA